MKKIIIALMSLFLLLSVTNTSYAATKPALGRQILATLNGSASTIAHSSPNGYVVTLLETNASVNDKIVLFNSKGKMVFQSYCKGCQFFQAVVGNDGTVYVNGYFKDTFFIRAYSSSGKLKWTNHSTEEAWLVMSPDQKLFAMTDHSLEYSYMIYSIDLKSGQLLWTYNQKDKSVNNLGFGEPEWNTPFGVGKGEIVSVFKDHIQFINTNNGKVAWKKNFNKAYRGYFGTNPIIAPNGNIAVNLETETPNGKISNIIQMYSPRGDLLWSKQIHMKELEMVSNTAKLLFNDKNELYVLLADSAEQIAFWLDANGNRITSYDIKDELMNGGNPRYELMGVNKFQETYYYDQKFDGVIKFNKQGKLSGQTSLKFSNLLYVWAIRTGYVLTTFPKNGSIKFMYYSFR